MLKHYITYYPDTDKLKTFRQTWKGKDEVYEIYHINGELSLEQIWDGDMWKKYTYNEKGRIIYSEDSTGYWGKREYDENGNEIHYEDSKGYWEKYEYDENGRMIYYGDSTGYWNKWLYNEKGNLIYWEK